MAALSDFNDVPALKYLYFKDAKTGHEAFFDFDGAIHRIQGIEYDLTRIKNDILKLKDKFKDLDAALSQVEAALEEITKIKDELLLSMEQLKQETQDNFAKFEKKLTALTLRVEALEQRCTGIESAITALNKRVDDANKNITALQGEVTKLKEDVTTLRSDITRIDSELDAIKADLRENYAKLKENNTFSADNTFTQAVTIPAAPMEESHATNKKYVDDLAEKIKLPAGTVVAFAGTVVPEGYLLCDGSDILKDRYPELYKAIGDFYGANDTHFRLPDLRDRFIQGGSMPNPKSQEPSLPNIMGNFTGFGDPDYTDGAFSAQIAADSRGKVSAGTQDGMLLVHFDASTYSPFYKNGAAKVTPPNYIMMYLIKA